VLSPAATSRRLLLALGPLRLDLHLEARTEATLRRWEVWQTWCDAASSAIAADTLTVPVWLEEHDAPGAVPTLGPPPAPTPLAAPLAAGGPWYVEWQYLRAVTGAAGTRACFAQRSPGLEHALRLAAAHALMWRHGLLFHAACVAWEGQAWLFPGAPGAGKSTLCREAATDRVLTNEIAVLAPLDGTWWAWPSPFWGTGDAPRWARPAPLAGVGILSHGGERNRWQPLEGVHAMQALASHLGVQTPAQASDPALLTALERLVSRVPVATLARARHRPPLEDCPWKPSSR
jgi:hypothetical protein